MAFEGEENSKRRKRIMKKTYRNIALAAALALSATGLLGCSTSVQIPDTVKVQQGDSSDNRITVSGMEEVKAVPDMAQIQYSVYTQVATAQECQEENAKNVNQTMETLKGLGVEDKSIQTSDYGMNPIYDWNSGRQKITGYQMTTSITVSDIPVENAGKIITDSVASGVNELDSVQYLCSDYDEKYQEALKKAVEMARSKADAMAEAAGMTVVKAVNMEEEGYYPQERYNAAGASKQMMAVTEDAAADMGVMPGEISIEAQVNVTFEME